MTARRAPKGQGGVRVWMVEVRAVRPRYRSNWQPSMGKWEVFKRDVDVPRRRGYLEYRVREYVRREP